MKEVNNTKQQLLVDCEQVDRELNLFPLLLSPGVLQVTSLASLLCLFNWRALIKILFVSVFTTCPSTITKIEINKSEIKKYLKNLLLYY